MIDSFRKRLHEKFLVRFHASIILTCVVSSGIISNRILYHHGLKTMAIRYPMTIIGSYMVFFIMVRLWLSYIRAKLSLSALESTEKTGFHQVDIPHSEPKTRDFWNGLDLISWFDLEGIIILAAGWGMFIASIWLVLETPAILTEAAFQMALSAGLIKGIRAMDSPDWSGSVLKKTVFPFLVLLFGSLIIGAFLQGHCPNATKIHEALVCSHNP